LTISAHHGLLTVSSATHHTLLTVPSATHHPLMTVPLLAVPTTSSVHPLLSSTFDLIKEPSKALFSWWLLLLLLLLGVLIGGIRRVALLLIGIR
jgi:hypothetical protein